MAVTLLQLKRDQAAAKAKIQALKAKMKAAAKAKKAKKAKKAPKVLPAISKQHMKRLFADSTLEVMASLEPRDRVRNQRARIHVRRALGLPSHWLQTVQTIDVPVAQGRAAELSIKR